MTDNKIHAINTTDNASIISDFTDNESLASSSEDRSTNASLSSLMRLEQAIAIVSSDLAQITRQIEQSTKEYNQYTLPITKLKNILNNGTQDLNAFKEQLQTATQIYNNTWTLDREYIATLRHNKETVEHKIKAKELDLTDKNNKLNKLLEEQNAYAQHREDLLIQKQAIAAELEKLKENRDNADDTTDSLSSYSSDELDKKHGTSRPIASRYALEKPLFEVKISILNNLNDQHTNYSTLLSEQIEQLKQTQSALSTQQKQLLQEKEPIEEHIKINKQNIEEAQAKLTNLQPNTFVGNNWYSFKKNIMNLLGFKTNIQSLEGQLVFYKEQDKLFQNNLSPLEEKETKLLAQTNNINLSIASAISEQNNELQKIEELLAQQDTSLSTIHQTLHELQDKVNRDEENERQSLIQRCTINNQLGLYTLESTDSIAIKHAVRRFLQSPTNIYLEQLTQTLHTHTNHPLDNNVVLLIEDVNKLYAEISLPQSQHLIANGRIVREKTIDLLTQQINTNRDKIAQLEKIIPQLIEQKIPYEERLSAVEHNEHALMCTYKLLYLAQMRYHKAENKNEQRASFAIMTYLRQEAKNIAHYIPNHHYQEFSDFDQIKNKSIDYETARQEISAILSVKEQIELTAEIPLTITTIPALALNPQTLKEIMALPAINTQVDKLTQEILSLDNIINNAIECYNDFTKNSTDDVLKNINFFSQALQNQTSTPEFSVHNQKLLAAREQLNKIIEYYNESDPADINTTLQRVSEQLAHFDEEIQQVFAIERLQNIINIAINPEQKLLKQARETIIKDPLMLKLLNRQEHYYKLPELVTKEFNKQQNEYATHKKVITQTLDELISLQNIDQQLTLDKEHISTQKKEPDIRLYLNTLIAQGESIKSIWNDSPVRGKLMHFLQDPTQKCLDELNVSISEDKNHKKNKELIALIKETKQLYSSGEHNILQKQNTDAPNQDTQKYKTQLQAHTNGNSNNSTPPLTKPPFF